MLNVLMTNHYHLLLGNTGVPTSAADLRTDFVYDGLGRLRKRVEYTASGPAPYSWSVSSETRYLYDGNRVIQERNSGNTPTVSYTRGTDLSGSLEDAGGIGGLLARSHGYSSGNWTTHNFYHADGNGNVTYLVNSSQSLAATYRYDPFGNTISSSGTLASANIYRFSSKEIHVNTGMYYYLYRFYDPNLQRWINRDPLGDSWGSPEASRVQNYAGPWESVNGGNLFHFVYNNPINQIDPLGLDIWIIKDPGGFGHQWVVGDNCDRSYWDSDMMPGKGPLSPACAPANINFNPKSGFDPKNPGEFKVIRHIQIPCNVTSKVRDAAERRSKDPNPPKYNAVCNNCTDYTRDLADFAERLRRQFIGNRGRGF